jgi:hypothetical protein
MVANAAARPQTADVWRTIKRMTAFLFSCENATCAVPEAHRELFRGAEEVVESTEGWEPGSLNLGQGFAMRYRTPLVHGDVTRLLIDFEKDGDERWSRFSIKLPEATRGKLAERHEKPFQTAIRQRVAEDLRRHASVVHVMVHTDSRTAGRVTLETPKGALLAEKIATAWRARMMHGGDLDVRCFRNSDGSAFATALAQEFPADQYAQVRLDVSQSFFLEGRPWRWEALKKLLVGSLTQAVDDARALSDRESPAIGPH